MPTTMGSSNPINDKGVDGLGGDLNIVDPLELVEGKRHPLFENMENAKFFQMKAPNMEALIKAVHKNEWAVTKSVSVKLKEAFN